MPTPRPTILDHAARALGLLIGAVLLLAALGKALEPRDFARVVAWVTGAPVGGMLANTLAFATIGVEFLLGTLLAVGVALPNRTRWVPAAATARLCLLTIALVRLLTGPDAPDCGCLSLLSWEQNHRTEAVPALARNAAMIGACLWLTLRSPAGRPQPRTRAAPPHVPHAPHADTPRAFTLLELLLSITIIAILIALALPAFRSVRSSATWTRRQAMHPQLLAAVSAYTIDNHEYLPYFAQPREPALPAVIAGFPLTQSYFRSQVWHWPSLIYPNYFTNREAIEPVGMQEHLRSLGWPDESIVRTFYFMADCAFATPEYFTHRSPATERNDPAWFRGMRLSDVMFPSSKGLLLDAGTGLKDPAQRARGEQRVSIGRVDGSASFVLWLRYFGDPNWVVERQDYIGSPGWPVMQTIDGLLGRDPLEQ